MEPRHVQRKKEVSKKGRISLTKLYDFAENAIHKYYCIESGEDDYDCHEVHSKVITYVLYEPGVQ